MTERARDLLADYVLGALSEVEAAEFEAALETSTDLQAELRESTEAFASLSAALEPVPPPAGGRDRLLDSVAGSDRFLPFVNDIARYADLAWETIREYFGWIDDPARWEAGPLPGISLIHFAGGPNAFGADTGFVKFVGGLEFPLHRHLGPEVNYVMSGAVIDSDGRRYGPGEPLLKTVDQDHSFKIPDDEETIIFVAQSGFDILPPD